MSNEAKSSALEINVTADDILRGERNNCVGCPVARAATRVAGRPIAVGCTELYLGDGTQDIAELPSFAELPASVSKRIARYDETGRMKPFKFCVDVWGGEVF